MKRHRFIGSWAPEGEEIVIDEPGLAHQISAVLRLQPGEEIVVGNGRLEEAVIRLSEVGKSAVRGTVVERRTNATEPVREVTLYAAILKNDHFSLVAEKATELGVSRIIPVIAERTVKRDCNTARLSRIAKEAAEQSGRGRVPQIAEPIRFAEAVEDAKKLDAVFFLTLAEGAGQARPHARIGVFVGPEGGWTDEEEAAARQAGFVMLSLGPRTLRAETAAMIGVWEAVRGS